MNTSKVLIVLAGALTLTACSRAIPVAAPVAQSASRPVQAASVAGIKNAFRYMAERIMQTCDKSGDEFLQYDEAKLASIDYASFDRIDKNRDQKLSLLELVENSFTKEQLASFQQMAVRNFGSLDVQPNDGLLSIDEFLAQGEGRPQEWTRAMFNMNDKNRDRKLTLSEYEDYFAWYCAADLETYLPKPTPTASPSAFPTAYPSAIPLSTRR